MIDLKTYSKVKDSYCLGYFGNSHEYVLQIYLLKSIISAHFPGIDITIGCTEASKHLVKDGQYLLDVQIKEKKRQFGHIFDLRYNSELGHPVELYLKNCGIENYVINTEANCLTKKCIIVNSANYPTKPLTSDQINKIKKYTSQFGLQAELGTDIDNAGWVIGVESVKLFEAASLGIKTSLTNTGIGINLYKKMFPKGEILNIGT